MSLQLQVFVVDDEPDVRTALARLLKVEGLQVRTFGSATEFLEHLSDTDRGCVVLDVSMPEFDGLALQRRLAVSAAKLPIVFLTGHGDIPMSVQAMKAGAIDFLTKPVRRAELMRAVQAAFDRARTQHAIDQAIAELRARLAKLTPREREVFEHVIAGRLNKVIAARLGTTEQTIKVHRGRLMEKLAVDSVAELVRVAHQLDIPPAP